MIAIINNRFVLGMCILGSLFSVQARTLKKLRVKGNAVMQGDCAVAGALISSFIQITPPVSATSIDLTSARNILNLPVGSLITNVNFPANPLVGQYCRITNIGAVTQGNLQSIGTVGSTIPTSAFNVNGLSLIGLPIRSGWSYGFICVASSANSIVWQQVSR